MKQLLYIIIGEIQRKFYLCLHNFSELKFLMGFFCIISDNSNIQKGLKET